MSDDPKPEPEGVPARIESAMSYLHYAQMVRKGSCGEFGETNGLGGRELSSLELRVYDAALSCLAEYFNSTGDASGVKQDLDKPEPPKEKVGSQT